MASWGTGISLKGAPGSKIYFVTGTVTDSNASAVPGDVAFTTDTFQFFQRTSTGWPSSGTSVRGPMGVNGVSGSFFTGTGAPASSLGSGQNALYIAASGEVYTRKDSDSAWTDSNESLVGPAGPAGSVGQAGDRGTYTYTGQGAPSSDLTSFSPGPARAGDLYYDLSGGPILYVLGN